MSSLLQSFGTLLPGVWIPGLVIAFLVFTILAWVIPTWRGNALSSGFGFLGSLGGIYLGRWMAAHRPPWLRGLLHQLEVEAPQGNGVDLRPHIGSMFMTLAAGGLAYILGMIAGRFLLRLWLRWVGNTESDKPDRPVLSPFH